MREVSGIEDAYIYGSWAARAAGEPGLELNDVDVLLIGDVNPGEMYAASRQASSELSRDVNISMMSRARWDAAEDGFIQTLKSRPLEKLRLEHWKAGSRATRGGADK